MLFDAVNIMTHVLSPTTLKILNILNDCEIHAGTDIAEELRISRTAVWKVIQRLKQYNIDIESKHHGYLLNSPLILLDKNKIEKLIKDSRISLECFETLPSTNDYLRDKTPPRHLQVCLTEHQSKGRGRMGRPWTSPFGRNIYMSISYIFNKDISELSGLSLAVGVLTADILSSLDERVKPLLKWPNDLYVNRKKLGGILIDIVAEAYGNCTAIMGIGLNVNMKDSQESINKSCISLEEILNTQMDRNNLSAQLVESIVEAINTFESKGLEPFLGRWSHYDGLENKLLSLKQGNTILSGIARGITPQGYLRLELPSGEIKNFSSGDTTILKEES